jgi:hypothetical protein
MLSSNYKFQKLGVFQRPIRLLMDNEKEYILSLYPSGMMLKILIDDDMCTKLMAKEDDIISIRDNNTDIYRLVVKNVSVI